MIDGEISSTLAHDMIIRLFSFKFPNDSVAIDLHCTNSSQRPTNLKSLARSIVAILQFEQIIRFTNDFSAVEC